MLAAIENEYSFLNCPGLLDPHPGEGPGNLHFYQEMLLLWTADPAVRTGVPEEDEGAERGARPPNSGKERDWRSSLADQRLGWNARVPCRESMDRQGWWAQTGTPRPCSPRGDPSASFTGWGTESGAEAIQPGPKDSPAQGLDLASLNSGTVLGPQAQENEAFGISDERRSKL